MPGFQENVEAAWEKQQRGRKGWGSPLEESNFPAPPPPCSEGSWSFWLSPRVSDSPTKGQPDAPRSHVQDGDRMPGFQEDVEAVGGKKAARTRRLESSHQSQYLSGSFCAGHRSLSCTQGACLFHWGNPKVARRPPGDEARMPGFQRDVEAAWGKKRRGRGGGWDHFPEASAFLAATVPGQGGSRGPWHASMVCVFSMEGT